MKFGRLYVTKQFEVYCRRANNSNNYLDLFLFVFKFNLGCGRPSSQKRDWCIAGSAPGTDCTMAGARRLG